jgi:hypothetical protein
MNLNKRKIAKMIWITVVVVEGSFLTAAIWHLIFY